MWGRRDFWQTVLGHWAFVFQTMVPVELTQRNGAAEAAGPVNASLGQAEENQSCWSLSYFQPYTIVKENMLCSFSIVSWWKPLVCVLMEGNEHHDSSTLLTVEVQYLVSRFCSLFIHSKVWYRLKYAKQNNWREIWFVFSMFVYFSFISRIFLSLESAVTLSCVNLFSGRIQSPLQEDKKRSHVLKELLFKTLLKC